MVVIVAALAAAPLLSQGGAIAPSRGTVADAGPRAPLDKAAERWVEQTLNAMTLDEKIGQLLFPSFNAAFTSDDSDLFEAKIRLARNLRVGGFHTFGGNEPTPPVLLNDNYRGASASRKGDAYAAAVLLNRFQRESKVPLLASADFEGGVGYILDGGTRLPRAMALGAARDPELAFRAGRLAASEGRSLGVTVDFYPVVDVNNNPRNPIINIRSFGEDPALVADLARAYIRGIHAGGMLATAKHFPGHGDTATDTHLGLALIAHPRSRLDRVELPPFAAAISGGVDAVMSSHIVLPALDPSPGIPATLSRPILTGLLRDEMKFEGLVFTDSMSMHAVSSSFPPDKAAAMAVKAGADCILDSPDDEAAFRGIKAAVQSGEIPESQITQSAARVLRAKARLGLHRARTTDLAQLDARIGGRDRSAAAADLCARALTLVKDDRNQVPLTVPRDSKLLYLSVIDYASGWREGAPSRAFIPALEQRWPNVTAVEITDRTTANEMDLVREIARRSDAVVVGIFVRVASYSGRMDLTAAQASLVDWLSTLDRPVVAVAFGNPYVVSAMPRLPAVLLAYEFFDTMEVAAVRALAGETPIGGRLPITLPGLFPAGHGLVRGARQTAPATTQAAQAEPVVDLTAIAPSVWVHTSYRTVNGFRTPSNGLLVKARDGGLILVDTAWGEAETKRLLQLAAERVGGTVKLALITHSHDDRIGGINALRGAGIRVVSTKLTGDLAAAQGLPAPEAVTGNPSAFTIGGTRVEFYFPGPGHSPDNAVVWLPDARVLFGGCLLKAMDATNRGNVADADLKAWPKTVQALTRRYAKAAIVVPGHGAWGGPELLEHTLRVVSEPVTSVSAPK